MCNWSMLCRRAVGDRGAGGGDGGEWSTDVVCALLLRGGGPYCSAETAPPSVNFAVYERGLLQPKYHRKMNPDNHSNVGTQLIASQKNLAGITGAFGEFAPLFFA